MSLKRSIVRFEKVAHCLKLLHCHGAYFNSNRKRANSLCDYTHLARIMKKKMKIRISLVSMDGGTFTLFVHGNCAQESAVSCTVVDDKKKNGYPTSYPCNERSSQTFIFERAIRTINVWALFVFILFTAVVRGIVGNDAVTPTSPFLPFLSLG